MGKCWECKNRRAIARDCHISCAKSPAIEERIGSCGPNSIFPTADDRVAYAEESAKKNNAVVRCIWPGSGFYPSCFDDNTVMGCANFENKTEV